MAGLVAVSPYKNGPFDSRAKGVPEHAASRSRRRKRAKRPKRPGAAIEETGRGPLLLIALLHALYTPRCARADDGKNILDWVLGLCVPMLHVPLRFVRCASPGDGAYEPFVDTAPRFK